MKLQNIGRIRNNEKGQTLIAIVFIMAIALTIGVTISDRFIKGIRGITESDNSNKALHAAEAAVERLLVFPSETLEEYITNNSCGTNCHVQFTDTNGQLISADVVLSFTGRTTPGAYELELSEGQTTEIYLQGYAAGQNVYICWNSTASVSAQYIYSESGVIKAMSYAVNAVSTLHPENNFGTSTAQFSYQNCFTIATENTPLALRVKTYYEGDTIYVLPASGYELPVQGILIESTGRAGNATRKVTVIKSSSYVPGIFDNVLTQTGQTDSLSN